MHLYCLHKHVACVNVWSVVCAERIMLCCLAREYKRMHYELCMVDAGVEKLRVDMS